jgi:hypothetical protein
MVLVLRHQTTSKCDRIVIVHGYDTCLDSSARTCFMSLSGSVSNAAFVRHPHTLFRRLFEPHISKVHMILVLIGVACRSDGHQQIAEQEEVPLALGPCWNNAHQVALSNECPMWCHKILHRANQSTMQSNRLKRQWQASSYDAMAF